MIMKWYRYKKIKCGAKVGIRIEALAKKGENFKIMENENGDLVLLKVKEK